MKNTRMDFDTGPYFQWDNGVDKSYEDLMGFHHATIAVHDEYEELHKLCVLFEFPSATNSAKEAYDEMRADMVQVKQLCRGITI